MRKPTVQNGKGVNLYLPEQQTSKASELARERYGISLSELVARLLVKEIHHPKGMCSSRPRELAPKAVTTPKNAGKDPKASR